MSSITNAAEDLAYLPFHNCNITQAQDLLYLTYPMADTSSTDTTHTTSSSLGSPNSQVGFTDQSFEQFANSRGNQIHRGMANDENSSSRELSPINSFENFRRPPRYATKDNRQFTYPPTNSVTFDAKKQFIEIIVHGLWRWLVTVSFVAVLIGSIWHFKSQEVLSPIQVTKFNAINIKFSIILGLNISSAFKKMALNVRWRVMSQRVRPLSEIDIFLQCDSLISLTKAAYTIRRPKVIMACLTVLLLNLTVQVGLATLSLAYSMDRTVQAAIFKPDSQIWVTDFKSFRPISSTKSYLKINSLPQSSIAHNRGVEELAIKSCHVSNPDCQIPEPGTTRGNISTDYWGFDSHWQYIMMEHPPNKLLKSGKLEPSLGPSDLSVFSGQSVITHGSCMANAAWITRDNDQTYWNFKSNNTKMGGSNTLPDSTLFLIPNIQLPACSNDYSTSVWAYEAGPVIEAHPSNSSGWFYQCCLSVNETTYPNDHEATSRRISPEVARIAVAAIGLEGFHKTNKTFEFQKFQRATHFGRPQHGNITSMAMLMAEFAVRVFASSGYENPMVNETGWQPQQGSKLNITNPTLMKIILPFIVSLHLACLVASALVTYRVGIPDISPLSIANIFHQHMGLLGGRASLLKGSQIAKVLGDPHLVYTSVSLGNGKHKQAVFESRNSRHSPARFEDGIYL